MRWMLLCVVALLTTAVTTSQTVQDRFFDSNGVRIRFLDQGAGEPVVFVHGLYNTIESNWTEAGVSGNLARDHRVVAFDLRGHGKSDKPHDPRAFADMALDVVRLLDHLSIPRAHIVGYSVGGAVVVKLLTTHPNDSSQLRLEVILA